MSIRFFNGASFLQGMVSTAIGRSVCWKRLHLSVIALSTSLGAPILLHLFSLVNRLINREAVTAWVPCCGYAPLEQRISVQASVWPLHDGLRMNFTEMCSAPVEDEVLCFLTYTSLSHLYSTVYHARL